jgi:hypothetical protein
VCAVGVRAGGIRGLYGAKNSAGAFGALDGIGDKR